MPTEPERHIDWATDDIVDPISGQNNVVEPPDAKKATGWERFDTPPRQWFNWLARFMDRWNKWNEAKSEPLTLSGETANNVPIDGSGHTHLIESSDSTATTSSTTLATSTAVKTAKDAADTADNKATPKTLSGTTANASDGSGHTHFIESTDATDTTPGRLMAVGAGGLLSSVDYQSTEDFNNLPQHSGFIGTNTGSNHPANAPSSSGFSGFESRASTIRSGQLLIRTQGAGSGNKAYFRGKDSDWSEWSELYHTGNILGTVSQSGGVPTGAIIERGSNGNGEYVKFADGTMIVVTRERSSAVHTTLGSTGSSVTTINFNWPEDFSEIPSATASLNSMLGTTTGAYAVVGTRINNNSNIVTESKGSALVVATSDLNLATVNMTVTGRWD